MFSKKWQVLQSLLKLAIQKGLVHIFSANCFMQLLGFGSILLVSKILSPHELGSVKLMQAYIIVAVTFAVLGHSTAVMRFCAVVTDPAVRVYILRRSIFVCAFAGLGIALLLAGLGRAGILSQDVLVQKFLPLYAAVIPFQAVYTILLTYLQARKQFKKMAGLQSTLKIFSFVCVFFATYFGGMRGYLISIVGVTIVSLLLLLYGMGRSIFSVQKQMIPHGFYFLAKVSILASLVGTIGQYTDMFFLDQCVADRVAIGQYALASIFLLIGRQVTGSVQAFLSPYFAEHSGDGHWMWSNMKKYQSYLSAGMFGISLAIFILGWGLVKIYYGIAYEGMISFLAVLLFQMFLHSGYAIPGIILMTMNKVHHNLAVATFYLLLKSLLCYLWVQMYGIWGIVAAQVVTEVPAIFLEYAVMYRVFCKQFGKGNF